jgi:predicted PurR-regulated permease PerM
MVNWMIGFLVLGLIIGVIILYVAYAFIREGIKDDLAYPISSCDTSMMEECMPEEEKRQ